MLCAQDCGIARGQTLRVLQRNVWRNAVFPSKAVSLDLNRITQFSRPFSKFHSRPSQELECLLIEFIALIPQKLTISTPQYYSPPLLIKLRQNAAFCVQRHCFFNGEKLYALHIFLATCSVCPLATRPITGWQTFNERLRPVSEFTAHVRAWETAYNMYKARFKRRVTAVSNSIDRIKFDFNTTVARRLIPSLATAV